MKKIIELALAMTLMLSLAAYQNHASESDEITYCEAHHNTAVFYAQTHDSTLSFGASHVFQ